MQANVEHAEIKMTDLKSNAVKNKSRNILHNLRNKSFPTPEFVPGCDLNNKYIQVKGINYMSCLENDCK